MAGHRRPARRRHRRDLTLDIQHLESLNDVVERITGVTHADTVPDGSVRAPTRSSWSTCRPRHCAGGWRTATSTPGRAHRRRPRELLQGGTTPPPGARPAVGRRPGRRRSPTSTAPARHRAWTMGDDVKGRGRRYDRRSGRRPITLRRAARLGAAGPTAQHVAVHVPRDDGRRGPHHRAARTPPRARGGVRGPVMEVIGADVGATALNCRVATGGERHPDACWAPAGGPARGD